MSSDYGIPVHPLVKKFGYFVEGLFLLLVLFGPWALGTTEVWSIYTLSIGSAVFFLMAALLALMDKVFTARYFDRGHYHHRPKLWYWADWIFLALGLICLLYVFIQWVNAQSDYIPGEYLFKDYPYNEHLPSSMDKWYTLFNLTQYVCLFCACFGARFLFMTGRAAEQDAILPARMVRFLWVALSSAFIMVIVGSLMRLDKTTTLLWIAERTTWAGTNNSFGPYGYRSTAAQYMNLLWPLGIAFWWTIRSRIERRGLPFIRTCANKYLVLAVMALFVFGGVWIAISRGGVWIGSAIAVLMILLIAFDALRGKKSSIIFAIIGIVLIAGAIFMSLQVTGKDALRLKDTESEARLRQYEATWPIYHDYPTYGIGAGAYYSMYEMYVGESIPTKSHYPSAHSDWLQLLVEFGNVGTTLVVSLLLWGLLLPWITRRGNFFLRTSFIFAFMTALIHAIVDLPFYVLSVSWLFVVLLAAYQSLPRPAIPSAEHSHRHHHHHHHSESSI